MIQSQVKSIDGILPQPKTELGEWRNWLAYATAFNFSVRTKRVKIAVSEYYNCMECGDLTNYWKPGLVCYNCEAKGERQFEESRGN